MAYSCSFRCSSELKTHRFKKKKKFGIEVLMHFSFSEMYTLLELYIEDRKYTNARINDSFSGAGGFQSVFDLPRPRSLDYLLLTLTSTAGGFTCTQHTKGLVDHYNIMGGIVALQRSRKERQKSGSDGQEQCRNHQDTGLPWTGSFWNTVNSRASFLSPWTLPSEKEAAAPRSTPLSSKFADDIMRGVKKGNLNERFHCQM